MRAAGFTLIEVMAASAIAAVVASGTMMAFVAAARMSRAPYTYASAEASGYAQQTLEQFRNEVATDSTFLSSKAGATWWTHALPPAGSTESILNMGGVPARRCYRVTAEDCDGVGGAGDCYAMQAKVCWRSLAGCPCP